MIDNKSHIEIATEYLKQNKKDGFLVIYTNENDETETHFFDFYHLAAEKLNKIQAEIEDFKSACQIVTFFSVSNAPIVTLLAQDDAIPF